ncbi:MAG: glycoside hydrolase family 5 protein [Armatimonadetes bacterium]|nr:glycoside hydrolase family 5 protein [Armatimonadota bacterium]
MINLLKTGFPALLALCFLGVSSSATARSAPKPKDPPRVTVVRNAQGLSVRTGKGGLLRGGAAWVFQYGRKTGATKYIHDPDYWKTMKNNGLNAVRLIAFDPWQRSHGNPAQYPQGYDHADLDNPEEVAGLLKDLDAVVNMASRHGMYVLLNYHDTGGYRDPDRKEEGSYGPTMEYLKKFWTLVAPRYKDRTHVFYELVNEPVKWYAEDYKEEHLNDFKVVYDLVRRHAPKTHIVLLSFANTHSYNPNVSMLTVAEKMRATGIDFKNESVGFHVYNTGGTSKPIVELMKRFPVITTEQNFPGGIGIVTDTDSVSMDGDLMGVQTMERLGISWFHWKIEGRENLKNNYIEKLLPDARAKGYLWFKPSASGTMGLKS